MHLQLDKNMQRFPLFIKCVCLGGGGEGVVMPPGLHHGILPYTLTVITAMRHVYKLTYNSYDYSHPMCPLEFFAAEIHNWGGGGGGGGLCAKTQSTLPLDP